MHKRSGRGMLAAVAVDAQRPYLGAAGHYAEHRHRVSAGLLAAVAVRLGLTRRHRALDLGCGPGTVALRIASLVGHVVAADPEPDMLAEGRRRATAVGVDNVSFLRASSVDLTPVSAGGPYRVVTIGIAFHWMAPRDDLLRRLDRLVDSGGAVVLISPETTTPRQDWWLDLDVLLERYLADAAGGDNPAGRHDPFPDILGRSPFGRVEQLVHEYDLIEPSSLAAAIGFRYSLSWVLQRLGGRRAAFEAEAQERFGWVDSLGPRVVRRRDVALIGLRGDSLERR